MQPYFLRLIFVGLILFFHYNIDYLVDICKYCRLFIFFVSAVYLLLYPLQGVSGGIYQSYQYTALNLSLGCGFFIPLLFSKDGWNKNTIIQIVLIIVGILITGKRTVFVIPIVMILIVGLLSDDYQKYKKLFIIILGGIALLLLASTIMPSMLYSIERLLETTQDSTFNYRKYFWQYAMDLWEENKLFGIGFGCYSNHIATAGVNLAKYGYIRAYDAHNIYYQLLAETGIIGLALFVYLFLKGIVSTYKNIKVVKNLKNSKLMYLELVSLYLQLWFVIYGMTGNGLYMSSQFFAYIFGVMCNISVGHVIKKYEKTES